MSDTQVRLDELDRRIVAALQVDGRASWRRIAGVLGEPERTIARRGTRLLRSGIVVVTGMSRSGDPMLLRIGCAQGMVRTVVRALAQRADTTFVYALTGTLDCIAEVITSRLDAVLLDELPATPGLVSCSTHPVLRYFRTVHQWQPGLLTDAEVAELREFESVTASPPREGVGDSREDRLILQALAEDGRRTHEDLGHIAGISEATARRRVERLRQSGRVLVRAVVEPDALGLPVEAVLWIRTRPAQVEATGQALLRSPLVRYAAATTGEYQVCADVTVPDRAALYEFVTAGQWLSGVRSVEPFIVVSARKRSGVQRPSQA
ncbi:Lrp/AsnC family transcriptional regulator [Saccharopolyspora sp. K220]|uniref:Lrp/AsnC family transcriptional regulator n=1 Tax=Saccharopolyspora soli TaxID=2926618 RepID=UPI001F59F874|nr:Lrp/AsnC family transcriptional regulator [Saccharopolyspora soli]MCI2420768.1 Lrp/AsnC family transcriptional regulator [Saccharopolyspora soli]